MGKNIIKLLFLRPAIFFWSMCLMTLLACGFAVFMQFNGKLAYYSPEPFWTTGNDSTIQTGFSRNNITVSLTNYVHEQGVLNPATLKAAFKISETINTIRKAGDPDSPVVGDDHLSLGNISIAVAGNLGPVEFRPLLKAIPPESSQIKELSQSVRDNPLLHNILLSKNHKALAFYFPILENGYTPVIKDHIKKALLASGDSQSKVFFTGLTYAEEDFHYQNRWMVIAYPLLVVVGLGIFLYLSVLPTRAVLSMVVAATCTSLLLNSAIVLTNYPAGALSFYIPALGAVLSTGYSLFFLFSLQQRLLHSEQEQKSKIVVQTTAESCFSSVAVPTIAIALSLLLFVISPLGDVISFGCFSAVATATAFLFSCICFANTPIFIGTAADAIFKKQNEKLAKLIQIAEKLTDISIQISRDKKIVVLAVHCVLLVLGIFGTTLYLTRDSGVKWPLADGQVEQANRVINKHFAGAFELTLQFSGLETSMEVSTAAQWLSSELKEPLAPYSPIRSIIKNDISDSIAIAKDSTSFANHLESLWQERVKGISLEDDIQLDLWSDAIDTLTQLQNPDNSFLRPDTLGYVERLQKEIHDQEESVQSTSVVDIVKMMHWAIFEGAPERYTIPTTAGGVQQCLSSFTKSNPPGYLYRFINEDASSIGITFYLKRNDNKSIKKFISKVESFINSTKPPTPLQHVWTGPMYQNMLAQREVKTSIFSWSFAAFLFSVCLIGVFQRRVISSHVVGATSGLQLIIIIGACGIIGIGSGPFQPVFITLLFIIFSFYGFLFLQATINSVKQGEDWFNSDAFTKSPHILTLQWGSLALFISLVPILFFSDNIFPGLAIIFMLSLILAHCIFLVLAPIACEKNKKKFIKYQPLEKVDNQSSQADTEHHENHSLEESDAMDLSAAEQLSHQQSSGKPQTETDEEESQEKSPPDSKNLFDFLDSEQKSNDK